MFSAISENFSPTTGILLVTAAVICLIPLLSYLWYVVSSPGPCGLPVLGYYPFLREDYYIQLHELSKKHGDPYLLNIAGQTFLYLGDIKAIREAHVKEQECFSTRSDKHSLINYPFANGILYLSGEAWRLQRKLFAQSMKEIGLGANKEELRGPLGDSVRSTISALRQNKGKPLRLIDVLCKECAWSVARLFFGDDVSEEEVIKLNDAYLKVIAPMTGKNILLTGTMARYFLLPKVRGYSGLIEGKKEMEDLLSKIIQRHKMGFDVEQQPNNLVDHYLRKRILLEKNGDPQAKYFTDTSLVSTLIQIYGDGSLSIALLIAFFVQILSLHRKTQDELFEEITKEFGTEQLPTWEDRAKVPLMHSTMKELFRLANFFHVFPDMECTKETTVLGVRVPKGTITLFNFWAVLHDPKVYKNPEKFDPARFLPGPQKEEDPPVFGVGKRACMGEGMVMSELFMYVASLVQNFIFLPEEETAKLDTICFDEGVQRKVRAIPRSSTNTT